MDSSFCIAICDDNEVIRKKLEVYVKSWFDRRGVESVIYCYESGVSLLGSNRNHDLIFLDIEMPELNGIETAKKIREVNKGVPIVYATNYEDHQNLAFKVHAFEYLVKPIKAAEVDNILSDFMEYYEKKDPEKSVIVLRLSSTQVKTINVKAIYYIEYIGHKVMIKTKTGDIITRYYNMTDIFELLKEYDFHFIHKGYIVNMSEIETVKLYEIHMANGDIVPLAQKRAVSFREHYNQYLQNIVKSKLTVRG